MAKFSPQTFSAFVSDATLQALQSRYTRLLYAGNVGVDTGLFEILRKDLMTQGNEAARQRGNEGVARGVNAGRRACLEAGLWLLADGWEEAHRLCQDVETAQGAAWHGVVHRLEGDYSNSKYWWRQARGVKWNRGAGELRGIVEAAPAALAGELRALVRGYDPSVFVELVERHREDAAWREMLLDLQRWEWLALFAETAGT